jgi:hypothetical protein
MKLISSGIQRRRSFKEEKPSIIKISEGHPSQKTPTRVVLKKAVVALLPYQ